VVVPEELADQEFAYLVTRGRRTGRPHTIEIWFAALGDTVWMIAGGGEAADWVRNLRAQPEVTVRIGSRTFSGRARTAPGAEGEAGVARRRLAARYQGWEEDRRLSEWAARGLAVAVDLDP
jgi:deazaflavin-dependent oxidoreductase (nitroreductase family)